MSDERSKIAVFIDFDNIEIGVKTTLNQFFDVGSVLEAIKERGEIVTKVAYGDWTRAGDYGRAMSAHAIHLVQRNLTPGGDKNGADINLALDALEMAFTHSHINTFVIVGGDSDFISLVEKLKQYDRKVLVVGGRAFTSMVMQKNCNEFIAYENLTSRGKPAAKTSRGGGGDLSQAMPLVRRALKLLSERDVLPQLGLLKSTLLQLDSAFSERDYGAGSFRDFVQKLASAGHVLLKGNDRSFHVELRERGDVREVETPAPAPAAVPVPALEREAHAPAETVERAAPAAAAAATSAATESAGDSLRAAQTEGYRVMQQAFFNAPPPRWPLYVRQVKQIIKNADAQFDERKFGFGGIVDALRYGQREGLLRVERDRMGVVRVFPGPLLQKPASDQAHGKPGDLDAVTALEPGGAEAPPATIEISTPDGVTPEFEATAPEAAIEVVEAEVIEATASVTPDQPTSEGSSPNGGASKRPARSRGQRQRSAKSTAAPRRKPVKTGGQPSSRPARPRKPKKTEAE